MAWIVEDNMKKYKVRLQKMKWPTVKNASENITTIQQLDVQPVENTSLLVLMERDWVWSLYDIIKNIVLAWNYLRVWFSFYLVAML